MMNNKYLYNSIIKNISKGIKRSLTEDINNFDVTGYNDDQDNIEHQDVRSITKSKNIDNTIFDWFSDAMQYIEDEHSIEDEETVGRDILITIYNTFNCNAENILKYDEYTLGELFKNAIRKGLEISPETCNDIHNQFDTWLENKIEHIYPEPFLDFESFKDDYLEQPDEYCDQYPVLNITDIEKMDDNDLKREWKKYLTAWKDIVIQDIDQFIDEYNISDRIVGILTHKTGDYPTFNEWIDEYHNAVILDENINEEDILIDNEE